MGRLLAIALMMGGGAVLAPGAVITFTDTTTTAFNPPLVLRGLTVATGDPDADGDFDLRVYTQIQDDRYFVNDGGGHFQDMTSEAGVSGEGGITDGGPFIDFDNDGLLDMYVGTDAFATSLYFGKFYHNLDGLHFEEIGGALGVQRSPGIAGVAWGDINNDSLLDFFGAAVPSFNPPTHPYLFINGLNHFTDIWPTSGMTYTGGGASGTQIWFDYDDDGDVDLYQGGFFDLHFDERDRLWRNNWPDPFTEVSGAISPERVPTLGVQLADFDSDGRLDIFALNETWQNYVWRNNGDETFTDIATTLGIQLPSSSDHGFLRKNGCVVEDLDNDMDPDIYIPTSWPEIGNEPIDMLMINEGGHFVDRTIAAGTVEHVNSWDCCAADFNGDGFLDIFVTNDNDGGSRFTLWQNNGNGNHWFEIDPVGVNSNRDAFGLRAWVTAGGRTQLQESYCHPSKPSRLHFGLASNEVVDEVRLLWPSHRDETYHNLAADQVFRPVEGAVVPLPPTGIMLP